MDVDLLRPGMIPIAPNTKLWFEFLIDPSLLEEHLNNPHAGKKNYIIILSLMNVSYVLSSRPITHLINIQGFQFFYH